MRWNKKTWDRIFKQEKGYSKVVHRDFPRIARLFKKRKRKKVLDLGCGTGRHLVYLARRGFEVYGIDISGYGIRFSRKWLENEKLRAHLKVGDIYKRLPYKKRFFDAIISVKTIHHGRIGDIRNLIKEMSRVLKPDGLIFITFSRKKSKKDIPKDKLWKIRFVAPRTFIPLSGKERGLIHFWFNKGLLRKEFRNFQISRIWIDFENHYALLGEFRKKSKFNGPTGI